MTTSSPNEFWDKIKKLGPRKTEKIPMEVYDENGDILTDEKLVLSRWRMDFQNLYNTDNIEAEFDDEFQREVLTVKLLREDQMLDPLYTENCDINSIITTDEIRNLVRKTKNGKSCGIDCIPYEVLKNEPVIKMLHSLFQFIFDTGIIPSIWRQAIICPIL